MDGAARAPVRAVGGAGEKFRVHQVAPERRVVVVEFLEHRVDGELLVPAPWLKGLRDQVEQEQANPVPGWDGRDPAVPDKRTELPGQVAEQVHRIVYTPGRHRIVHALVSPLFSHTPLPVAFRGLQPMTMICGSRTCSLTPLMTSRRSGSAPSTCVSTPSPPCGPSPTPTGGPRSRCATSCAGPGPATPCAARSPG